MSTERTKQILNSQISKESVNTDTYLHINIEGDERILPTNKINRIINVAERFNVERQRSPYYRILGTINPSISNPLFNLTNTSISNKYTWATFNSASFLDSSWPEDGDFKDDNDFNYDGSIKHYLKDRDGWFGHYDPNPFIPANSSVQNKICQFYDMEPKRERFSFIPDKTPFNGTSNSLPVKNWELTITYPKEIDDQHNMVKTGLLIVDKRAVTVATRGMTALAPACKHNLKIGDIVKLFGTTGYDGEHVVVRTGLDDGSLKDYFFVIDKPSTGTIGFNSRMKKVVGGIESDYYFRIFQKIGTRNTTYLENDDYETYPAAFSENYFNDSISQFVFNEDINVSGLTDNLGRPLSQLYLTIIKTNSNNLFTNVSSGIETPFLDNLLTSNTTNTYLKTVPVISRIHNGGSLPFPSHTPLESDIKINMVNGVLNKNLYYGDLVEYNKNELLETVLADVNHRFNTINRETSSSLTYVSEKLDLATNTTLTKTTT
jgi:DNA-binding protein Fis